MNRLRACLAAGMTLAVVGTSGLTLAQGRNSDGGFQSRGALRADWEGLAGWWGHLWTHHSQRGTSGRCFLLSSASGTVSALSGQSISVVAADGGMWTLPLAPNVVVTQNGQASSLAAVSVGSSVRITIGCPKAVTEIDLNPAAATADITSLSLSPNPIAAAGSLAGNQTVSLTVYAKDAAGNPVPGGTVYLSFTPTTGGGTASVGGTSLTGAPQAFTAGSDGTLSVGYTTPAQLPSGGSDTLTAASAASGTGVTATDAYSFTGAVISQIASLSLSPNPVAAAAARRSA